MNFKSIHSAVGILLMLTFTSPLSSFAQKKKKPSSTESSYSVQSVKLREAEFYFTEGEKYFILEDYAKALLYYQKSLEINPGNATVHYKIAEVLARGTRQEDLIKAALSIDTALKLEKKNKYFYLLGASVYTSLARFDKAAELYESMIREVPGTEEYLYELAAVYQYANKTDEAIKVYNRAEGIFGISEISSVQKLRLYLESGKKNEALEEGEKLIVAFPGEERYVMAFAEVLSKNGQNDVAISYLETFTRNNREAGNARMLLAGLYRDNKMEDKARELLLPLFDDPEVEFGSKIIVLGTYNTEINQNKASNVSDKEKEAFALTLFKKLAEHYPNEANVHILGGDLYLSTGSEREAIEQYLEAIDLGEVNFEVWQNLLYLQTQLEQFDSVIKHSEECLELFPNQGMVYYFNGYAYLRKRKFAEAIFALEQAKKISSLNQKLVTEINSMLGEAYNATKQYDKSDKAYDEALAANPDFDIVLNNYSYYLALRKANLEKAEKMSAYLIKNNPDNATFLDTHAWVLFIRQKYKEAKKIMERAISTGKASATHFEHYGDILFKLGDVDGAVEQWEKARGMNANNETLNKKIANRKIYE